MNKLEKGILDDLSFEDLVSAYENKVDIKSRNDEVHHNTDIKIQEEPFRNKDLKCRFNGYKSCNDKCQYYQTCTTNVVENTTSGVFDLKNTANTYYEEYYNWLRKEHFLERVIDNYKGFAAEDKRLIYISDEHELFNYLRACVKEYSGQKRNFYKYYLEYLRKVKKKSII